MTHIYAATNGEKIDLKAAFYLQVPFGRKPVGIYSALTSSTCPGKIVLRGVR